MKAIANISKDSLGEKEGKLYSKVYRHIVQNFEID